MASPFQIAASKIPEHIKPPILVLLTLSLSGFLSYLASPWIADDIEAVTRPMDGLSDLLGLVGWRIVEVLGYWWGGWDATQAASLSALSLAPSMHFLHTYQPSHSYLRTLGISTIIPVLSTYLPMLFLRPRIPGKSTPAKHTPKICDPTRIVTTLLASAVYELTLFTLTKTFLTTHLLASGWDLESVQRVHNTSEAVLLARAAMMLPIGWAAAEIIFFSPKGSADSTVARERPASEDNTANADDEIEWMWRRLVNWWVGVLSPRSRRIIQRTVLVIVYQTAAAMVQLAGSAKGGDLYGAIGIGGVWTVATLVVGGVLGWVGMV
ncbi:hypothetical protein RUND412_006582 [Rhizina undulata]